MKNKKTLWILTISLFSFVVWFFCLVLKREVSFDKLNLLVSFIGLFATFGGALVGAFISGQYTLKSIDKEKKQQKLNQISEMQNILLFNADEVLRIFNKIFEDCGFNSDKALKKLIVTDNNLKIAKESWENDSINSKKKEAIKSNNNDYEQLFNKLQCKFPVWIEFEYEDRERVTRYIDILRELSPKYYLLQSSSDKEDGDQKYYINLVYQLKQLLDYLRLQMTNEDGKINLKIGKEGKFWKNQKNVIQAFHLLMKVHYEITLVQPENLI